MDELFPILGSVPQQFAVCAARVAGLMLFAPLFGSDRIPRPVKVYFALAATLALFAGSGVPTVIRMPDSPWLVAAGLAGELALGLLAGMLLSMAFTGARWAGQVAGQQMGFNLAGAISPNSDIGGNPLGDAYFILALFAFLMAGGHEQMLLGLRDSFVALPPLSFGVQQAEVDLLVDSLAASTVLAVRIAAPICCSMLIVDLSLGMLGKTIPALNLLSVGLSIRALVGLAVAIFGLAATGMLLVDALIDGTDLAFGLWRNRRG
jgi:flagellar biosynthetic protein FliR